MFTTKIGNLLTAALTCTCCCVPLASQTATAHRNSFSANPQAQIRVFNLARVPKRDLSHAEAEVARIFAEADMNVGWVEGAPNDTASLRMDFTGNNLSPAGCPAARPPRELRVLLLPRAPHGVNPGTLAFSLPCAAFGIDSTVFIDRCENVTHHLRASFNKVLAYTIAHELGHVLLRSSEHSRTGLMRAKWDPDTWLRATVEGIPIDPELARRMRTELLRFASSKTVLASR